MTHDLIKYTASLIERAQKFGFDWDETTAAVDAAIHEAQEVKEAISKKEGSQRIQEEMGDLLLACLTLLVREHFDIEETLIQSTKKFEKRLEALEFLAKESGLKTLHDQPVRVKLNLWKAAKERTNPSST